MNEDNKSATYDAIINGGGITGFALALQLHQLAKQQKAMGQTPWRILLADQKPAPSQPVSSSKKQTLSPLNSTLASPLRVSTINNSQLQVLLKAGLPGKHLTSAPVQAMEVWEKNGTGFFNIHSHEIGLQAMAYVIENDAIIYALYQCVQDSPYIDFSFQHKLLSYRSVSHEKLQLSFTNQNLAHHTRVETQLLIGSDGQHSKVRHLAGIDTQATMAPEIALVANLSTEHPHKNTARQVFLGNSILALLPIRAPSQTAIASSQASKNAISIVWSGKHEALNELLNKAPHVFEKQIGLEANSLDSGTLGATALTSDIASIPIRPQVANRFVAQNIVLVGDAAHTLHPLAGQGANLGLADCEVLANHLSKAWQQHIPLGHYNWNRRYERTRKAKASQMTGAIKTVRTTYDGSHDWAFSLARNLGVAFFNKHSSLHQWTMKKMQKLGA